MRDNMSDIGSVIIWLPTCFLDTRNFSTIGELAETDTAKSESAHKGTPTTATPTTVDVSSHELWFLTGFSNLVSRRHNYYYSFSSVLNGKPSALKRASPSSYDLAVEVMDTCTPCIDSISLVPTSGKAVCSRNP